MNTNEHVALPFGVGGGFTSSQSLSSLSLITIVLLLLLLLFPLCVRFESVARLSHLSKHNGHDAITLRS